MRHENTRQCREDNFLNKSFFIFIDYFHFSIYNSDRRKQIYECHRIISGDHFTFAQKKIENVTFDKINTITVWHITKFSGNKDLFSKFHDFLFQEISCSVAQSYSVLRGAITWKHSDKRAKAKKETAN